MRAALINLPQPGEGTQPAIAGKSIAQRQLLFARECGCTMIIAHGGGASPEALALRHATEKAEMRFAVISHSHALPGAVGADDSLLVLQPGLLPEAQQALDLLRAEGDRLLVASAGPGTAAGFERIDLDRAWAGALTIPGRLLSGLYSLPEDAAPHAALLRVALQKRLPEARLADSLLDDGGWMVVGDSETASLREKSWLHANLGRYSPMAPTRWLAREGVARAGAWLLDKSWMQPALLVLAALLAGGSITLAWYGYPVPAFALVAICAPVIETFLALSRLAVAPFGKIGRLTMLRHAVDIALLVVGTLSIDGLWYRSVFPPFVLIVALIILDRGKVAGIFEPLRDRALVVGVIAVLAFLAGPEIAIMLLAAVVITARLASTAKHSG